MTKGLAVKTHLYRASLATKELTERRRPSRQVIREGLSQISDAMAVVLSRKHHPLTQKLIDQIRKVPAQEIRDRIFQPDPAWNHHAEYEPLRSYILLWFCTLWSKKGRAAITRVLQSEQGRNTKLQTDAGLRRIGESVDGLQYVQRSEVLQFLAAALDRLAVETPPEMRSGKKRTAEGTQHTPANPAEFIAAVGDESVLSTTPNHAS